MFCTVTCEYEHFTDRYIYSKQYTFHSCEAINSTHIISEASNLISIPLLYVNSHNPEFC